MRKHLRKLALLSLFIMSMAFLNGCNTSGPSDTVKTFLNEVKKGDKADPKIVGDVLEETINSIDVKEDVDKNSISKEATQELSAVLKKLEYKINSETIEGDKASVNVTVTGPDLGTVIVTAFQKTLSLTYSDSISGNAKPDAEAEKIFNEFLLESLKDVKYADQVGDVLLEKKDGDWVIINSNQLTELLFNVDLSAYDQMEVPAEPEADLAPVN